MLRPEVLPDHDPLRLADRAILGTPGPRMLVLDPLPPPPTLTWPRCDYPDLIREHVRRAWQARERWDRQAAFLLMGVHL